MISKLFDILTLVRLHPSKSQDVNHIYAGSRWQNVRCRYLPDEQAFYPPNSRVMVYQDRNHGYRLYYRSRARTIALGWLVPILIVYLGLFLCQQLITYTKPNWFSVGTLFALVAIHIIALVEFINLAHRKLNQ